MAKLTVYIPDDLLASARALDQSANTSQLVQRGLERVVGIEDAAYARRPDDAERLLAAARERLAEAAAADFEDGYRSALKTAAAENVWPALDDLARARFDLVRWAGIWRDSLGSAAAGLDGREPEFDPPGWWRPMARDLGDLLDPIGLGESSFRRTRAFLHGYGTALREAWAVLEQAEWAGPPRGTGDESDGR